MSAKFVRPLLILLLLWLPASRHALAAGQSTSSTGTINGTVKDSTGALLQGAQIILTPSGATVASDSQGDFSVRNVRPGTYTATITYVGFGKFTSTVIANPGQTIVLKTGYLGIKHRRLYIGVPGTASSSSVRVYETSLNEN